MDIAEEVDLNHVVLRGRLADDVAFRELPSGDVLAAFRLTVARPPGERVRVDSIECVTTERRFHPGLRAARVGSVVEVEGSLHRRFWRSAAGAVSRYSVLVQSVRVVRPDRRADASPAPRRASA